MKPTPQIQNQFHEAIFKYSTNLPYYGRPSRSTYLANGLCFYYAFLFQQFFGGVIYSYLSRDRRGHMGGHCFIKLGDKFYDAENLEGVKNWKQLQPYLKRGREKNLIRHRTLGGVFSAWHISGQMKYEFFRSLNQISQNFKPRAIAKTKTALVMTRVY